MEKRLIERDDFGSGSCFKNPSNIAGFKKNEEISLFSTQKPKQIAVQI
jgi:hypothetical protein